MLLRRVGKPGEPMKNEDLRELLQAELRQATQRRNYLLRLLKVLENETSKERIKSLKNGLSGKRYENVRLFEKPTPKRRKL